MNDYEAKQEARRERLLARAERLDGAAAAAERAAHSILDHIPLGQPILVGHHSEKRHRRDLSRADAAMHRANQARVLASRCRARADGVGRAGISADDPEAPAKLTDKAAELEARRDHMKAANAAYRKLTGEPAERLVALVKAGKLSDKEAVAIARTFALMPYRSGQPFAAYELTNIGARIRQAKARGAELKTRAEEPEREMIQRPGAEGGPGFTIREDRADNRVLITFEAIPPADVRARLKGAAFKWSPTRGAWCRQATGNAWWSAALALGARYPSPEEIERGVREPVWPGEPAPGRSVSDRGGREALPWPAELAELAELEGGA